MGVARNIALAGAVVLCLKAGPAGATAIAKAVEPSIAEQVYAAAKLYDENRCDRAAPILDNAMGRAEFKTLDRRVLPLIYEMAASCAAQAGDGDKATAMAVAGTAYEDASDRLWALRLGVDIDMRAWDDAVLTLETLGAKRPGLLNRIELDWVLRVDRGVRRDPARAGLKTRLTAALGSGAYAPQEPFATADPWRRDYAFDRLAAGDREGARKALAAITTPLLLLQTGLDGRTAELAPDPTGLAAAVERRLAADRAAADARPRLLRGTVAVADDLRRLGRPAEALALIDTAAATLAATPTAFDDRADQAAWLHDRRAFALWELGRFDEAVEAMRAAAGLPEQGGTGNVSQTVNLAAMLVSVGRTDEALKVLEAFTPGATAASPYGLAWVAAERACAYAAQARPAPLGQQLDFLKAHEADNPAALARALLCANDLDGAAAAYLRRLESPAARADALVALSEFDPPARTTPQERELARRLAAVRARPEVQAAVARAGRTLRVPLKAAGWGDL